MVAMGFHKQLRQRLFLLGTLGFATSVLVPLPVGAVDFPDSTPSDGAPSRTASGAPRRSHCSITQFADIDNDGKSDALTPMTALVPTNNTISNPQSDLTFFIYTPQNTATSARIEINEVSETVVVDSNGNPRMGSNGKPIKRFNYTTVYSNSTLSIPESLSQGPRIVSYQLDDVELQADKTYEWSLFLLCSDAEFADPVQGLIACDQDCGANSSVLVPDGLSANQLMVAAQNHANQGLWNETIRLTAQLRESHQRSWAELLESQGLGCFAAVPFANDQGTELSSQDDPQCFVAE